MSHFFHCEQFEKLPAIFKENFFLEAGFVADVLPRDARALQVGCVGGARMQQLQVLLPDLTIEGFEIDSEMAALARKNTGATIHVGDITTTHEFSFDYVFA